MALLSPQLRRFLSTKLTCDSASKSPTKASAVATRPKSRCCSAIAIDAPSSLAEVSGVRWGYTSVQGPREEMEDDVVVRPDGLDGFSFAAVFDGHGGFSSAKFLRDELFKDCVMSLQGGLVLSKQNIKSIQEALLEAFANADAKLVNWLDTIGGEDESGSTATAIFLGSDKVFVAHVGDSCVVLSRSGKPEVLTHPHRPYGSSIVSLKEIRRIREAGGWVSNGRICGDISVSRAFGDIRYKTKKNEMLQKGVEEGRWSEKFISRIQFNGDLVIASPDIYQVALGSDAEFILLASDGLWDYMSSSDAVEFVRNHLRQHGDVQLASEALAEAALDRRSQDNITIVIADLGHTDWQTLPMQRPNVVYEVSQAFATIGLVSLGIWMSSLLS
ncbi:protein phosphatase 2C 57 [Rhodamnia argentea]|uniref:protein-serine/threonine phosphatase n=1 Tax=Rhodamnia argentea TaxID=178133 RepID=A0A8B8PCC8_9MYRT|nr:protein phosphatase 2C 57 [Rhodamnia argentea]